MSLRAKSHTDLQAVGKSSLDDSGFGSLSLSRFGSGTSEEVKGHGRTSCRRPVRAVRPLSASNGTFLHINHLQGELVRKRKECEDLRRENKFLSNEIHMERIVLRTESELTMRSLRSLSQEQQAHIKELKQKLYLAQQRAALSSRAADEAERSREESERGRVLSEAQSLKSLRDRDTAQADRDRLAVELQGLKQEHKDLQLSLAQTERGLFEAKLKLGQVSAEKQSVLTDNRSMDADRETIRLKLRQVTEENVQLKDSELSWKRRALASEEESQKATVSQREAEAERRLAEKERRDKTAECLQWRERHKELADRLREQDDMRALRQNKACQANIKSYFLCMTESDQRVKILRNPDGQPTNFTEGDPVYISKTDSSCEEPERSRSRSMLRVSAPLSGSAPGPSHFDELPAMGGERPALGGERPDSAPQRRGRRVVDYFWIPTDTE